MRIAIDTSKNKEYTGMITGGQYSTQQAYVELVRIFKAHGVNPPFHWYKITRKVKQGAKGKIIKLLAEGKVRLTVFHHNLPFGVEKKKYYLQHIPNGISATLEAILKKWSGGVDIAVDDDYRVAGVTNGTDVFIQNLISMTCQRLVGTRVPVRKNGKMKATIKMIDKRVINFFGGPMPSKESGEIQLVDVLLNCYLSDPDSFKKLKDGENKRVFVKTL